MRFVGLEAAPSLSGSQRQSLSNRQSTSCPGVWWLFSPFLRKAQRLGALGLWLMLPRRLPFCQQNPSALPHCVLEDTCHHEAHLGNLCVSKMASQGIRDANCSCPLLYLASSPTCVAGCSCMGPPAVSEERIELLRAHGILYHPLQVLQVRRNSRWVISLLPCSFSFPSKNLSVQEAAKKEFGMLWALLLQLDPFILFLGPQR